MVVTTYAEGDIFSLFHFEKCLYLGEFVYICELVLMLKLTVNIATCEKITTFA